MVLNDLKFKHNDVSNLPKYKRLADSLEAWIENNELPAGAKLPGDRQLAEHLNTTTVTITKSLNLLKKKGILERKVGSGTYTTDASTRQPRHLRIGIICHEMIIADPAYVNPVMSEFYEYWKNTGYQIVSLNGTPEQYEKLIHDYELSGAMIFVPREEFATEIKQLCDIGVPLVTIGGFANPELPEIAFGSDHVQTAIQAVTYLHKLGHQRIGIIASDLKRSSNILRIRGYESAMWDAGLPVKPEWRIVMNDDSIGDELKAEMNQADSPTAFIIATLSRVIPTYNVMNGLKLKIGKDISLLGLDYSDFLEQLAPPLDIFAQKIKEFSLQAAIQLENVIKKRPLNKISRDTFQAQLIEHSSSLCKVESQNKENTMSQPTKVNTRISKTTKEKNEPNPKKLINKEREK